MARSKGKSKSKGKPMKSKGKGMHMMPGGHMMSDAEMKRMQKGMK